MNFVIKRSEWFVGPELVARMLDGNGKKCCLGFLALACGHTEAEILNVTYPHKMVNRNDKLDWLVKFSHSLETGSDLCILATMINGDSDLSILKKETLLYYLFKSQGISVTFED